MKLYKILVGSEKYYWYTNKELHIASEPNGNGVFKNVFCTIPENNNYRKYPFLFIHGDFHIVITTNLHFEKWYSEHYENK